MAVPFAFAVAALLTGRLDKDWARWTRPWTVVAWMFLTAGITLGSWWAYYELGWGGWWFWDPVENSSFMPWLMATALLHSLAVTERRGIFKSWTVLLAIAAFSLSLLGTFLTRSPVLDFRARVRVRSDARAVHSRPVGPLLAAARCCCTRCARATSRPKAASSSCRARRSCSPTTSCSSSPRSSCCSARCTPLFIDALGLGKISVGPAVLQFDVPGAGAAARRAARRRHAHRSGGRCRATRCCSACAGPRGWPSSPASWRRSSCSAAASVLTVIASRRSRFWVCASSLARSAAQAGVAHGRAADARRRSACASRTSASAFSCSAPPSRPRTTSRRDVSARPGDTVRSRRLRVRVQRACGTVEGPNFVADEGEFELREEGELVVGA